MQLASVIGLESLAALQACKSLSPLHGRPENLHPCGMAPLQIPPPRGPPSKATSTPRERNQAGP